MVIKGVATRKVKRITESLCGLSFSKSQVSDICQKLDTEIQGWLNRPLDDEYPYVLVDARYEKVRRDHKIESHAILIAVGVSKSGKRDILGVAVCNEENETNWSLFFKSLKERGLKGVLLVISDAHRGLVVAIEENFPGCQWQRCQVHFKKNILDKVRNKDKTWVKKKLDDIFFAPDKETGLERLQMFVRELSEKYPDAADILEEGGEDALTCLNFPVQHQRRIRTTNSLERFNQEIKRRTRVVRIFPNRNAALRLIGALCMEQAEEWITGRQYLDMRLLEKDHPKEKKIIQQEKVAA
jgi:transposase-like protein